MNQAIKFRRRSSVQGDASADVRNTAQADDAADPEAEQGGLQAPAGDAPLATAENAQPAAADDAGSIIMETASDDGVSLAVDADHSGNVEMDTALNESTSTSLPAASDGGHE